MSAKRVLLVVIGGIILFVAIQCGPLIWLFSESESFPPEDPALEQTHLMLDSAKTHPVGPIPTELPFDMLYGAEQCWSLLQETMAANDNQYTVVLVGVWGDAGTHYSGGSGGTGTTEVVIEVVFPDETRIEMYYYAYTLEVCRELNNNT